MSHLGSWALELAFAVSVTGLICGLVALATGRYRLAAVARNALYANCFLACLATFRLVGALLAHDFSLKYVAQYSSSTMPDYYLVTSLWGGHAGSLLFWLALLSIFSAGVAFFHRKVREGMLMPGVHVTLLALQSFFLFLLCFLPGSMPFEAAPFAIPEGRGLNPLLQDPVMAIHPPTLYLGFVGLSIPFAFAIGALLSGRKGIEWIRLSRWWTILSWNFLTMGIILGGFWAYRELGWGGYWAWDPVENSSFLPWLAATAFLHSVMVTEKYRMLKVWNMVLIFLAFALTIFGTFLTRSGFLSSVHTFAEDESLFWTFLAFLLSCFGAWLVLVAVRWKSLRSEHRMHSFLSREFMFLANNLVFVSLTVIVLVFTIWPNITERIVTKLPDLAEKMNLTKQSIGASAYDVWTAPFFLLLILLTGLGTAISWKATTGRRFVRSLAIGGAAAAFGVVLCRAVVPRLVPEAVTFADWRALSAWGLAWFVLALTIEEFAVAIRARSRAHGESAAEAVFLLFCRNHRRYGGYLVHLGVVFIVLGVTTQRGWQQESITSLRKGQTYSFAGFDLQYVSHREFKEGNMTIQEAEVSVAATELPGTELGRIKTQKRYYDTHPEQPMTEVGYLTTHGGSSNLYLVLAGRPESRFAAVQIYFNPLINLIWFGSVFLIGNAFLLLLPWKRIGQRVQTRRARARELAERRLEDAIERRRRQVV